LGCIKAGAPIEVQSRDVEQKRRLFWCVGSALQNLKLKPQFGIEFDRSCAGRGTNSNRFETLWETGLRFFIDARCNFKTIEFQFWNRRRRETDVRKSNGSLSTDPAEL